MYFAWIQIGLVITGSGKMTAVSAPAGTQAAKTHGEETGMGWLQDFIHEQSGDDADAEDPVIAQQHGSVLLFEPEEFNDISQAADQLIAGRIIVINLHKMAPGEKQRIVDFINGVVYSHQGRITKGGRDLILCSPEKEEMVGTSYQPEDHSRQ